MSHRHERIGPSTNHHSGIPYMVGFILAIPVLGYALMALTPFFKSIGLIP